MILYGEEVANNYYKEIIHELNTLYVKNKIVPCIVIIQANDDIASKSYVNNKIKVCDSLGIKHIHVNFGTNVTEEQLIETIEYYNKLHTVHGIIVQLPISKKMNVQKICDRINPVKDVDCFNSINVGKFYNSKNYELAPCTPFGIKKMLQHYKIKIEGKKVLIIGRSNIVGKPMAEIILKENGIPIVTHSKVNYSILLELMKEADIIITACGKKSLIDEFEMKSIKKNTTIIDVSMNKDINGKLCGDIDKKLYISKSFNKNINYSPVPKGVGPCTVMGLIHNLLICYKKILQEGEIKCQI